MNAKLLVWAIIGAALVLVSCNGTVSTFTPPPTVPTEIAMHVKAIEANMTAQAEYAKMLEAQRAATQAAANAQQIAAQVTSIALQTREALNVQATQTRRVSEANAAATLQSIQATATQQAAQYTATAFAQSIGGTATMQSIIAQQTQVSASATATANAANAHATQVSADATATVIAAQVLAAQEKADWERRLESLRALGSMIGGALLLLGIAAVIGLGVIRFIDAGVLRARVIRDKTGTVFVIGERDERGRQMVLVPGRSPGAVLNITPPAETPLFVEGQAIDEETTKRDQAISLMIAATSGNRKADDMMRELSDAGQIKIVDEPPAQIASGEVKQILDGDWQRLGDGK